jgi:hypothetical protein
MEPMNDVGKLAQHLRNDEEFRTSFLADPIKAMKDAGVDREKVPPPLIDALSHLKRGELDAVMKANKELNDKGMSGDPALAQFPV